MIQFSLSKEGRGNRYEKNPLFSSLLFNCISIILENAIKNEDSASTQNDNEIINFNNLNCLTVTDENQISQKSFFNYDTQKVVIGVFDLSKGEFFIETKTSQLRLTRWAAMRTISNARIYRWIRSIWRREIISALSWE